MRIGKTVAVAGLVAAMLSTGVARPAPPKLTATIYVTNGSSVTAYAAGSHGNVAPIAVIGDRSDSLSASEGDSTTGHSWIRWARGIAVDQRGKIYVANGADGGNRIVIFSAGSRGNVAPIATIAGTDTGLDDPFGVAVDSQGKIYVTNPAKELVRDQRMVTGPSSITTYAEGANGNAKPIATITGVIKTYTPHDLKGWTGQSVARRYSQEQLDKEWQRTVDQVDALLIDDPVQRNARLREIRMQRLAQIQQHVGAGAGMPDMEQRRLAFLKMQAASQSQLPKPGPTPIPGRKLWAWTQSSPTGAVPEICIYPIGNDGEVTRLINWGTLCELDFSDGIAIDANGDLYMPSSECFGGNVEKVTVAPAGSSGSGKPTVTITGSAGSPHGIVVDKSGNIYVTNDRLSADSITVYPAGGRGKVTPIANIAGRDTLLNGPHAIALDSSGKIYVVNGDSVTVYPAGSNGDVKPIATISGADTGLVSPTGIAVDADRNIYVTTEEGPDRSGSVNIYSAGSNGNAAPIETISGSLTGLSQPAGIALGPPIESAQ
jgi:hypothetical protein